MIRKIEKNSQQEWKKRDNLEFTIVKYFFIVLFFALSVHYINFQINESEEFINNNYNSREELFAERVVRGDIRSADGMILAETVTQEDGTEDRYYNYDNLFSHVVGYASNGKSGIEKIANFQLLKSHVSINEKVATELDAKKHIGDNVITTLNYELQKTAYDQLSFYEGAIIVMEPKTGKILAMVSKPDFNPNDIEKDWDYLISEDNTSTVLLNRATQGLYPPGSTFKMITTLAYLRQNQGNTAYAYTCMGKQEAEESLIRCYKNKKHGEVDLEEAFAESCNSAFSSIGLSLNEASFQDICDDLLFNRELPTQFAHSKSRFQLGFDAEDADVMQAAIGQGTTVVTPFHMALITSAIANDGVMMTPYVIDRIESHTGDLVKQYSPSAYKEMMTKEEALQLQEYMKAVVEYGTGKKLSGTNYEAAGKTGSAEFSAKADASHSWFVGYAHQEGKEDIAVAILVEEAGSGSSVAVPMAKKIFDSYFLE